MINLLTDLFLVTTLLWAVSKLAEIPKEYKKLWRLYR